MDKETIDKHWEAEKARFLSKVAEFYLKVKHEFQTVFRGYSDVDTWSFSNFVIDKLQPVLKKYVEMEAESGKNLPAEFATDPAAWLVILKKMEYSFDSVWLERHDFDHRKQINMTQDQQIQHNKDVQEGFELFGKHIRDLWE